LKPAQTPAKALDDLKARMQRVFPTPDELQITWEPQRASRLSDSYGDVTARLQPFDNFFGGFDA
jgi:hypothetical protein